MEQGKIGKYEYFKQPIAKGSFSIVYKGINNVETVAIKKIYKNDKNSIYVDREINTLQKINHENILKFYDYLEKNDKIFLIIEYCEYDLDKFLNRRPLKEKHVKKIFCQIVKGLKYLHDNDIIHRDLKPHNILLKNVNGENVVKICDFGLAKNKVEDFEQGTICGTPLYMAPEIITEGKYSYLIDFWSLGIILYEMVYGTQPYLGKTHYNLVKNIKTRELDFNDKIKISDECKDMIKGLLQFRPEDRYDWNVLSSHSFLKDANIDLIVEKPIFKTKPIEIQNKMKRPLQLEYNEDIKYNIYSESPLFYDESLKKYINMTPTNDILTEDFVLVDNIGDETNNLSKTYIWLRNSFGFNKFIL